MADSPRERRKFPRRQVKLSCRMQLGSGVLLHGKTHDLSLEGAMMETRPLPGHQQNMTPKAGDLGFLILHFKKQGISESMKIRCRIVHIQANRIGLFLISSNLSEMDKQNMAMILETGSGLSGTSAA